MADPVTILAVAAASSAAVGAVGAIQSGRQAQAAAQSEANMDEYNSKVADIQARQTYAAAGRQEDEQRRQARAVIGQQLAASAEAGAGLNGDLLRQSVFDAESDTQAIRYEAGLRAQGLTEQAAIGRSSASSALSRGRAASGASYLNAAGSLLNGATSYYGAKVASSRYNTK